MSLINDALLKIGLGTVYPIPDDQVLKYQKEYRNRPIVFDKNIPTKNPAKKSNLIVFENKSTPTPTPTPTATPTPTPTPQVKGASTMRFKNGKPASTQQDVMQFIETTVLPITREYGIPDAVAAGQFAAEGRLQGLGASRNNFFNLGAYDSNVDNAFDYKTPEDGVRAYADLIARKYPGVIGEKDPVKAIQAVEKQGYAGDPKTWRQRKKEQDGVETPYRSYSDFVMNNPEWRQYYGQASR